MTFRKLARVSTLAFATYEGVDGVGGFKRIAAKSVNEDSLDSSGQTIPNSQRRSYYVDGVKKIDVRKILAESADKYRISADPSDYIFEAIRANTTNVPNENHDAFHKTELLRFDLTAGKPVYRTYEGKPHHINHLVDNPKTARGVIVDAHYFDETPALDKCPGCDTITKEASQRDPTGIHCKKCGTVVKDEFVEILVAVDTKKDPPFAEGVRQGTLNAGSMGCSCSSTTCNVCHHVAHTTAEFCEHIRRGNKGSFWAKDSRARDGWRRIEKRAAAAELQRRARRFITADFCHIKCDDGFEVRKAHERCNEVGFEEFSRVDEPADPKATQREVLKAAAKQTEGNQGFDSASLALETRALLLRAELIAVEAKLESKLQKSAQLQTGLEISADVGATADISATGLAILDQNGEIQQLPEGTEIIDDHDLPPDQQQGMQPFNPGFDSNSQNNLNLNQQPHAPGPSIQDVTDQQALPGQPTGQQQWGPEAMGILPKATTTSPGMTNHANTRPTAAKEHSTNMTLPLSRPFSAAYGDLVIDVTEEGNGVVVSKIGPVLTVSAGKSLTSETERVAFGQKILASIHTEGLVDTIRKYDGSLPPRFAQILDTAVNDMEEYHTRSEQPIIHDMEMDRRDDAGRAHLHGLPGPTTDRADSNMENNGDRESASSTIGDRVVDREDAEKVSPSSLSTVDEQRSDMRGKQRPQMSIPKSDVLQGGQTNMRGNAGAGSESMRSVSAAASSQDTTSHSAGATRPAIPAATPLGIAQQWQGLDHDRRDLSKDRHLDVDNYPHPGSTALQQGHQHEASVNSDNPNQHSDTLALESRLKKLNAARIASIQKEADERVAAVEATIADRFARALRIVAKREALNLEESPMKAAMFELLANEQIVGQDSATGENLVVSPISADLAQHFVERAYQTASTDEINRLVTRAAELMKADPGYIASAESDLAKQSAVVPMMTAPSQLGIEDASGHDNIDEASRRASQMRRAASQGNLYLTPSPEIDDGEGFDHRGSLGDSLASAVRLGNSKTNQRLFDLMNRSN